MGLGVVGFGARACDEQVIVLALSFTVCFGCRRLSSYVKLVSVGLGSGLPSLGCWVRMLLGFRS